MILFKADTMIKAVFNKTIKVMGEDIEWNELIVVNNNSIILPGKRRSIIFSFDNSRVINTIVDLDIKEADARLMCNNSLLENAFNMLLYIFGKWGQIKGLTVEKNVKQLESMIKYILSDIEVEAQIKGNKCQFFKKGIRYTYEDIIQDILELMNPNSDEEDTDELDTEELEGKELEDNEEKREDNNRKKEKKSLKERLKIGLWHKMVWKSRKETFERNNISKNDRFKIRLGRGFYGTGYNCPDCGEALYMAVYPVGKEFKIETDEKPVRLARAYTCSECLTFMTPKPNLLLGEGVIYKLDFDDDKAAYEDYLDLIGADGERISNCNFNVYESDYNTRTEEEIIEYERAQEKADSEELERICESLDDYTDEELYNFEEKFDDDFYSSSNERKYGERIREEAGKRRNKIKDVVKKFITKQDEERFLGYIQDKDEKKFTEESKKMKEEQLEELDDTIQASAKIEKNIKDKFTNILRNILGEKQQKTMLTKAVSVRDKSFDEVAASYHEMNSKKCEDKVKMPILKVMHEWLLDKGAKELQDIEKSIPENITKQQYENVMEKVNNYKKIAAETGLQEEIDAESCVRKIKEKRDKAEISEIEDYLQKNGIPLENYYVKSGLEAKKEVFVQKQTGNKHQNETSEADDNLEADDYSSEGRIVLKDTVGNKELIYGNNGDNNSVISSTSNSFKSESSKNAHNTAQNSENVDKKEPQRLTALRRIGNIMMGSEGSKKLKEVYDNLKSKNFEEHNVKPYLDDLYDKIYEIDKIEIEKLCPDITEMTFDEGMEAYKKIEEENFLPELKVDVLKRIDDRLRAMKRDECISLVKKFSKDMEYDSGYTGLYMYDPRRMTDPDNHERDCVVVRNALNTYGVTMKYEYPLIICDCSHSGSGKKGFTLTPDNIYFNCGMSSGALKIKKIDDIYTENGFLNKGIYANYDGGGGIKISNIPKFSNKTSGVEHFIKSLNEFIEYLKEKPESRTLEYMVKENHEVKCCYRCGFVYKTGDVCPKCGSRNNS